MYKYLKTAEINEARSMWIIDNQSELVNDEKYTDLRINLNLKRIICYVHIVYLKMLKYYSTPKHLYLSTKHGTFEVLH